MIVEVLSGSLSFPPPHPPVSFHHFLNTWTLGLQIETLLGGSQCLTTRVLSVVSLSAIAILLPSGPFGELCLERERHGLNLPC